MRGFSSCTLFDKMFKCCVHVCADEQIWATYPQDPEVLKELEVWKKKIDYFTYKNEGNSSVVLDSTQCQYRECNIGNVITDAFIHYRASQIMYDSNVTGWTDAPIAYINSGSIRASIDARSNDNSISLRDLIDVMPFSNLLVKAKISGDVLLEMLEHGVSRYDPTLADNRGSFPQLSGLQVVYNIQNPVGKRVVTALARCSECEVPAYFPVKTTEKYTLLVNSFIAKGGNGYTMIGKGETVTLDETDTNILIDYMNKKSPIFPEVSCRIVVTNSGNYIQLCSLTILTGIISVVLCFISYNKPL